MSDASVVAKEANRVILAMRLRAEKAEADAGALAEALEHYASEELFGADGDVARETLSRYRGEK